MHTPRFWISLKHPFIAVPGNKQMGVPAVIKNVRIARRKLCGFVQGVSRLFRNGSKAFGCRLQISAAHGFGGLTKVVVHTGGPLGASSRNQTTRPTQEKKGQALDQRLASCQRVCCWPSDYKQMTGWHNNSPHKFYTCYRQGQGTVSFNKKPSGWDVSQRVR